MSEFSEIPSVGRGIIASWLSEFVEQEAVLVADRHVYELWSQELAQVLPQNYTPILLPAGEAAKSIELIQFVWKELLHVGATRDTPLVVLGGGATLDAAGFSAATYKRGIPLFFIPTTLLAQCDACLGGKNAINFLSVKNAIGSFYQPSRTVCDLQFLSTLERRELVQGFAEIVKHALIGDSSWFEALERAPAPSTADEISIELVTNSLKAKAAVIKQDVHDTGIRKILNFGHTAGHAFETLASKRGERITHGEAVGLGMLLEAKLSLAHGLPETDYLRIRSIIEKFELPASLSFQVNKEEFLDTLSFDKKNKDERPRWSLLTAIGHAKYDVLLDDTSVLAALDELQP